MVQCQFSLFFAGQCQILPYISCVNFDQIMVQFLDIPIFPYFSWLTPPIPQVSKMLQINKYWTIHFSTYVWWVSWFNHPFPFMSIHVCWQKFNSSICFHSELNHPFLSVKSHSIPTSSWLNPKSLWTHHFSSVFMMKSQFSHHFWWLNQICLMV